MIASIRVIAAGVAAGRCRSWAWSRPVHRAALQGERGGALRQQVRRRIGVEVVEHRLDRLHRRVEVGVDLLVDALAALVGPGLLFRFAPHALRDQVGAQARNRIARPGGLHFVVVAVAARVVGGGVVVQAVGEELDHAAAFAVASALGGAAHAFEHGEQVVAVDLQAVQAAGQALLRQRLGAGLRRARHRDRPAVVDHAQHQRRGVGAGGIQRGVEVGLRRTAVAAAGHRRCGPACAA